MIVYMILLIIMMLFPNNNIDDEILDIKGKPIQKNK